MKFRILAALVFMLLVTPFVFAQANTDEDLSGRNDSLYVIDAQDIPDVNQTFANQKICDPGFKETLTIRALDKELNPITGVGITTKHQIDQTTGKGYFTSPYKYTDETGIVKIPIVNTETQKDRVDCIIEINATMNNMLIYKTINAMSHAQIIDFVFPAARLTVAVVDQRNKPIEGAVVYIENLNRKTNEIGLADFIVLLTNHTVFVKYLDYKVEKNADVDRTTRLSVEIPLYNATVKFSDDKGNPIKADLVLANHQYESNENGELYIPEVAGNMHSATAIYRDIRKNVEFDLDKQSEVKVVFDFNPPEIKDLNISENENNIRLILQGVDEGRYASGVATNALSARYRVENGLSQQATIYVRARGVFVVEIPKQENGKTITYSLELQDRDGNKQNLEAKYVAIGTANTGNETGRNDGEQKSEFPLVPIIGGILILCVVIVMFYAVFRLKNQEKT